jgi:hypothetical protein
MALVTLQTIFQEAFPAYEAFPENWRNFWRQAVSHLTIITCDDNQKTTN